MPGERYPRPHEKSEEEVKVEGYTIGIRSSKGEEVEVERGANEERAEATASAGGAGTSADSRATHNMMGSGAGVAAGVRAPRLKVCVMTCQVLQTSTTDDTDAVLPGLSLAAHLAVSGGHDVTLVFFLHNAPAAERHRRQWEQDARAAGVTDLQIVSVTRHYYLPTHLAHAFEAYAWLVDRNALGAPPFGVVHFADGHGLAYYTALAKHQDSELLDLRRTRLVGATEQPHLWLAAPKGGGGRGLESVDDLEINFVERSAASMVDDVLVSSQAVLTWMEEREWKLPAGGGCMGAGATHLLPRLLPARRTPPSPASRNVDEDSSASADSRRSIELASAGQSETADDDLPLPAASEVVFLLEGPGGGGLGQGVSAGGQGRDHGVKDPSEGELYPAADVALAAAAAEALLAGGIWPPPAGSPAALASKLTGLQLAAVAAAHPTRPIAMFLTLGPRGDLPTAAQLVERIAREREWPFAWMVATANQGFAVAHLANRTRIPVIFAARHRGSATLALVRRVLDQAGTAGGSRGRGAEGDGGGDRVGEVDDAGAAGGTSVSGSGRATTRATLVAAGSAGGEVLRELIAPARILVLGSHGLSLNDGRERSATKPINGGGGGAAASAVLEIDTVYDAVSGEGGEAAAGVALAGGVLRALAGATPPVRGALDEVAVAAAYLVLYEGFAAAAAAEAAQGTSAAAGRWWPSPGGPAPEADGTRWWDADVEGGNAFASAPPSPPPPPPYSSSMMEATSLSSLPTYISLPLDEVAARTAALRVVGIAVASGLSVSPPDATFWREAETSPPSPSPSSLPPLQAASLTASSPLPAALPSYTGRHVVAVSV